MTSSLPKLAAIPLPGLWPESLGNYLASLGLLRILARRWPEVRIAWKDGVLHVVGGPDGVDALLDNLLDVAAKQGWTPYVRGWLAEQKQSTKVKSGAPLAKWQADAPEEHLELFIAHVVPRDRAYFNPLFGSGGNAGKRAFSDGWKKAVDDLQKESLNPSGRARKELKSLLMGEPVSWLLEKLNAASWFSDANKLYNSGQRAYRDGRVSPWAMALACEGIPFFAGSASRRLGSRARAVGAFPFVAKAAAPNASGEAGRDNAEVWAPIWDRPMTLPEAHALFARGRAEIHGRGALTPAAFATAIVQRGVDAGIEGFLRFSLGRTTSENTFEPRFEGRIVLPIPEGSGSAAKAAAASAAAIQRVLALFDRLPADEKKGERWRFLGLKGPIERAIIQLSSSPSDPAAACNLLDAVVSTLDKVDRNQSFRAKEVSWKPLPIEWLPILFGSEPLLPEARLALAIVSGFPTFQPFALYRFGVDWQHEGYVHPKQAPSRCVWGPGELPTVLANVLMRRVLDWEEAIQNGSRQNAAPTRNLLPATYRYVNAWLDRQVDEQLIERWLSRLALFDWRRVPESIVANIVSRESTVAPVSGALSLFGIFQPLFDLQPLQPPGSKADLLDSKSGARTPAAARKVIALIRQGQLDAAVAFATSRYAMAKTWLVKTGTSWFVEDPERLLASFLFRIPLSERGTLVQRWLRPCREKGAIVYA